MADAYAGLFRAFVTHDKAVKVVTFWGVHDAVSWRSRGRPLLFDGNDPPKPALDAVIRAAIREPLSGGGETPYLAMIGAETPLIYEV